jgi:hypothetical protein
MLCDRHGFARYRFSRWRRDRRERFLVPIAPAPALIFARLQAMLRGAAGTGQITLHLLFCRFGW